MQTCNIYHIHDAMQILGLYEVHGHIPVLCGFDSNRNVVIKVYIFLSSAHTYKIE